MMALELSTDRPWWKEPMVWLVAGLPATAVVASFITYFIAAHDPDSLVRADYRKEGFALVEKTTDADEKATGLGLIARISVKDGHLEVTLKSRLASYPERVALTIIHPTKENQDIHILLEKPIGNAYRANIPDLGHGKRILVLEPEDRTWRVTGQWMAPFSGMTELAAAATNHSTHP